MDFNIGQVECDTLEWKEGFNDRLLEEAMQTLCAFLNSFGGKIIFGVDKMGGKKELEGDLDEKQRLIYDKAKSHLTPNAHPLFEVKINEGLIYVFVKKDQSKIYQYKKVTYKRTGACTHALTYEETKALEKQRSNNITEIAPQVFNRVASGERWVCDNCGNSATVGFSSMVFSGGSIPTMPCTKCGGKMHTC